MFELWESLGTGIWLVGWLVEANIIIIAYVCIILSFVLYGMILALVVRIWGL